MSNIKLSLSIVLLGSTMYSQEEAKALEQEKSGKGYNSFSLTIDSMEKKKMVKETLHVKVRNSRPASQSINISQEAYDYMISKEAPEFAIPLAKKAKRPVDRFWRSLPDTAKLNLHLNEICKSLGGTSYTYQVFED